jgi:glycosyltransferase involved in cell wall biosynthesis
MGVECIYEPQLKIWEYLASYGKTFNYLFVSRIYQARCFDRLLKQYCPQAAYIFNTVDVHFVREKLEAELHNDDTMRQLAEATRKYELAVAESADATIVISKDEKVLLEKEYSLTNIYHIPQARELFGLAPNKKRRGAVFIGSAHPPNMDGLRYFHDEILPLLPSDFKLTIIGEALKFMIGKDDKYKDLLKCPQFHFAGFVRDLADELDYAKITIAPLRYGAGTKGKVASSMSYGVPCVSSNFGTEGTGMEHGENIMIARDAASFAQYIRQLMEDEELWKKISDGGIKFIRDNYAPETVEKMMDKLLDDVKARHLQQHSNWFNSPVLPKVDEV